MKKASTYFLVCKGLSNDNVGVGKDTVSQEIRPGAGCKNGDLVEEKLGGYRRTTRCLHTKSVISTQRHQHVVVHPLFIPILCHINIKTQIMWSQTGTEKPKAYNRKRTEGNKRNASVPGTNNTTKNQLQRRNYGS